MKYYKRHWNESTGEELTDSWGTSNYFFETDDQLNVTRQIQIFENDNVLKYSKNNIQDKFGALADQSLDKDEFDEFEITKIEFENIWSKSNHYCQKKKWWKFW